MEKKFLSVLGLLFVLVSFTNCSDCGYIATIKYTVYYPNEPIEKEYSFESTEDPGYSLTSHRGSNYLKVYEKRNGWFSGPDILEETTSPIRVKSFFVRKK